MATKFTYTDSELKEIMEKYSNNVTLDALAIEYNKSVASIRMKLVKQGVYKKAEPITKTKSSIVDFPTMTIETPRFELAKTKSGLVAQFNKAMGLVGPALV